jgi:hypothetical protein
LQNYKKMWLFKFLIYVPQVRFLPGAPVKSSGHQSIIFLFNRENLLEIKRLVIGAKINLGKRFGKIGMAVQCL